MTKARRGAINVTGSEYLAGQWHIGKPKRLPTSAFKPELSILARRNKFDPTRNTLRRLVLLVHRRDASIRAHNHRASIVRILAKPAHPLTFNGLNRRARKIRGEGAPEKLMPLHATLVPVKADDALTKRTPHQRYIESSLLKLLPDKQIALVHVLHLLKRHRCELDLGNPKLDIPPLPTRAKRAFNTCRHGSILKKSNQPN
ncbi:MAG: hypothetical protein ACXIVE_16165 [Salinarimonas sp.]